MPLDIFFVAYARHLLYHARQNEVSDIGVLGCAAGLVAQFLPQLECYEFIGRGRMVHLLPPHDICGAEHRVAQTTAEARRMVQQLADGYLLGALVLYIRELRIVKYAFGTENLGVERK